MRRASELPWVKSMIQIGLRAVGSARKREVDDAAAFGSIRVRAEELHHVGVPEILRRVPDAAAYYISLDTDAIDPAIAPGINALEFGGSRTSRSATSCAGSRPRARSSASTWWRSRPARTTRTSPASSPPG